MIKKKNFYLYENGELKNKKDMSAFMKEIMKCRSTCLKEAERKPIESPEKDKVMKSIRSIIQEKEEMRQRRKNSVFLYGISSFMAVVVLVIGINLLNSYEKMKKFDTSFSNIALEISNISEKEKSIQTSDNSVSVNKIWETYIRQRRRQKALKAGQHSHRQSSHRQKSRQNQPRWLKKQMLHRQLI